MIKLCESITDVKDAIFLLQEFLKETAYRQSLEAVNSCEHLGSIIYTVKTYGYIWLAYVENKPVGLLMATLEPNIWIAKYKQLKELVWFVLSDHRKSTIGGRLFKTFCDQGDRLLEQGQIEGYFTTRMPTTDSIDLERRGFRLVEQTYLKER